MSSAIARTSAGAPVRTVPSGTAIRRASSEIATPILASPRSSPRTLPGSATGLQELLQPGFDRVEGLLERVPLRAAGEREVGLASPTPAHDLRRRLEELRRGHPPGDQLLRARRHQQGLAALTGPEHDGRAVRTLEAVRDVPRERAELVGVRVDRGGDELRALDDLRPRGELLRPVLQLLLRLLPELALELLDAFRVQAVALHVDLAQGIGADQRLDAPHAGADRGLVEDADDRDLARMLDVRAS